MYNNKTAVYIIHTIDALLKPLSNEDIKIINILIVLADKESEKRKKIHDLLKKNYKKYLQAGVLSIIMIPERFYSPLTNISSTFNDSSQRVFWRSKQSLDYAFVFDYVYTLCDYYVQIEDDVVANQEYFKTIWEDIERLNRRRTKENKFLLKEYQLRFQPWLIIEYYPTSFIGRVIPSQYLPLYGMMARLFYNQIPVDWGYPHMVRVASGYPAERMSIDLFDHIGKQSSLLGT